MGYILIVVFYFTTITGNGYGYADLEMQRFDTAAQCETAKTVVINTMSTIPTDKFSATCVNLNPSKR